MVWGCFSWFGLFLGGVEQCCDKISLQTTNNGLGAMVFWLLGLVPDLSAIFVQSVPELLFFQRSADLAGSLGCAGELSSELRTWLAPTTNCAPPTNQLYSQRPNVAFYSPEGRSRRRFCHPSSAPPPFHL